MRELQSLVHYGVSSPAVPNTAGTGQWVEGDPFSGVQSSFYWSSTTFASGTVNAWFVSKLSGDDDDVGKITSWRIWPVRDGQ